MPQTKIDNFMRYANFFYKCVGIEPYARSSRPAAISGSCNWSSIVYYASMSNVGVVLMGEALYVVIAFATGEHIVEAITTLSYIGFVVVGMFKLIIVWWKKSALKGFMEELEQLYPQGKPQQEAYRTRSYMRFCSNVSIGYALLYCFLIWTYNLFGIVQYLIYERWLQTRIVGQTLPYFVYVPWQYEGHWSYYMLLFLEIFAGHTSASGQVSTDLLLCAVATQLIMHYDYLARRIETIQPSGHYEQDVERMAEIVRYHERLLKLSASINDIFGVPLLLNFSISTFVICFVGFQMSVGVTPDVLFTLVLFLVSSLCQVYLICHYGQLLEDASSGLAMAAYRQDWLQADVRYKKALKLIMARAQKPAYLRATIFMQITRGTMTDLLQLSYKFFALLRTMYIK